MNHAGIFEDFVQALNRAYQLEELNLLSDFWKGNLRALTYLYNHKNEQVYPATLSDALHVTRSRITSALASLESKAFIKTHTSKEDGRRVLVTLTKEGEAFYEHKRTDALVYVESLVGRLGEENVTELTRLINLCVNAAEKGSKGGAL